MAHHVHPTSLYPDVVDAGSLAVALQVLVAEDGHLIPVEASKSDLFGHATVPSTVAHRKAMTIDAYLWKRHWHVRGEELFEGAPLMDGDTDDLTAIAKAAWAWHSGQTLADIVRVAPFVHLTGRFEVPNYDPAQLTESEWQRMRTEAKEAGWPEYAALVEAAYNEPVLRRLYPFTSHWRLRFSTSIRPHVTFDSPYVLASQEECRYTITSPDTGEVLAETTTAEGAVAMVVRHLLAAAPPAFGAE